ncbi:MAG: crotonase/enoyl-CoA hydratase family protein [Woeseiaceae bacterium]
MDTYNTDAVQYQLKDGIATITIDDGKRNALAPSVLAGIYRALDAAERDDAIVIITGREGVFSAGFDLNVMKRGGSRAIGMLRSGYGLPVRVLRYPRPVIVACNGHCLAMGVFLMLAADCIVGTRGDFKISANEVAIGMTMPRVAAAMLRHRLRPAAYQRAVALAQYFDTEEALDAGFFDELVKPDELAAHARDLAERYKQLDSSAHRVSKRRIRAPLVRRLRWSRPLDLFDAAMVGVRMVLSR